MPDITNRNQIKGQTCRLTITGLQYPPRAEGKGASRDLAEPIVTVEEVCARYCQRGGSHYLFYEEQPEGCPGVLKTRVKRKGDTVEIHRRGAMGGSMVFEAGGRYRTEYQTPFGALLLDIVTQSVETAGCGHDADREAAAGWPDVKIRYTLENQGEVLGEYELVIRKCTQEQ